MYGRDGTLFSRLCLHNYPDRGDAMCRGKHLQPSPSSTWPRTTTSRHHSALHCIFRPRNNFAIDTTPSCVEPFTLVLELAKDALSFYMLYQLPQEDAPTWILVSVVDLLSVLSLSFGLNKSIGNLGKRLT